MLEGGGNAVDAAVAAAAVLCVTEPMSTGVGGDLFAVVWRDGRAVGLDAAGPAPAAASPVAPVAEHGPTSVTVPGAVAGWGALVDHHGTRGLDECLAAAIDVAEGGFSIGPHTARMWSESRAAPAAGEHVRSPELAATLRRIADSGPSAMYRGPIAEAIVEASWLSESDLAGYAPRWVEPLRLDYRGVEVLELPPPTQGVAALEALGILGDLEPGLASQVEATRLAMEDAFEHVRDGADVEWLIADEHLRRRRGERAHGVPSLRGGTVYLCAVDESGTAVSLIQSLYDHFGSGVVAGATGVTLHNRAACFAVEGHVTPGRRPYHTLMPGLMLRDGRLLGPFGILGDFIQPQAHVQFVTAVVDDGCDPQSALDRPRFRIEGDQVLLEQGLWHEADTIRSLGLEPVEESSLDPFGAGQAILAVNAGLAGGSDHRRDGSAAGYG